MLFQSFGFLFFFSIFFFLYWSVSVNIKLRNILLLFASLYLYSLWSYVFLSLLIFIILLNFFSSKYITNTTLKGKLLFYFALIINLSPLFLFKYFDFFLTNINDFICIFGFEINFISLKFILPVGISFYTFLSISYLIDVYRKKIKNEINLVNYALSISYFPIILSGPIHRPIIFLNQINARIHFKYELFSDGLRQVLTGLFLKVVLADNLAPYVTRAFTDYSNSSTTTLVLGTIYFSFQLYFDFNGYSEMAIGISKLLGFPISRNFKNPYLSRTISDFWKSWHISLTQWFRDYVFLPLSYIISRKVKQGSIFDSDLFIYSAGIIITWTLTGLWHGAGWNYILWGMIHALLLILNKAFFKPKKKLFKRIGLKKDSIPVIIYDSTLTFIYVNLAWIFFRSSNTSEAIFIIKKICKLENLFATTINPLPLLFIAIYLFFEYYQRKKEFLFDIANLNIITRWSVYIIATTSILFNAGKEAIFIYFKF